MDDDLFDEIIFNDLDDALNPSSDNDYWEDCRQAELKFQSDEIYNKNGVSITACASDCNYVIITDKYQIYWYPMSEGISIYHCGNKKGHIIDFNNGFKMSYFAKLYGDKPWEIEYSSAEFVNKQIERINNLKVFL